MAELISKEGNKVEFKVEVPAAEVNRTLDSVWKSLAQQVRVPGFRAGKAPRKIIEKRVGEGYAEAMSQERLINSKFPEAARELELSLVDFDIDPSELKSGQTFTFSVKGDLYPEVSLSDWQATKLSSAAPEITDEVLEQTLADLRERAASFDDAERPVEATDMVMLQEEGEEDSYPIYMDMAESSVTKALMGKNVGDEVEMTVEADEEGGESETVKAKITGIRSKNLPALDDDFASSMSFESLDKLRETLRGELERRAESEGQNARREELVDALIEGMKADIPDSLIRRQTDDLMEEIKGDLSRQGVRWSEYEHFMKEQGKLDDFMEELRKNAEIRVKRDLALGQLAKDLDVQVSNQELSQNLMAIAQMSGVSMQEMQSQMGASGLNALYGDIVRAKALTMALDKLSGEGDEAESSNEQTEQADSPDKASEKDKAGEEE